MESDAQGWGDAQGQADAQNKKMLKLGDIWGVGG